MMETTNKERIRDKAQELFLRYGIRSVSMDDIATHLGMSKKTIYQYYTDKNELVEAVVEKDLDKMENECVNAGKEARNAVEEIFITVERTLQQFQHINPMLIYDLEKFHNRSFQRFMSFRNKFLLEIIRKNLEWGVKDELYRPEVSVDIMSKYRLETLMVPFNMDLYPPSRYNFATVHKAIIEHFVFGLASAKGYKLILKYQKERLKKEKQYETEPGKTT